MEFRAYASILQRRWLAVVLLPLVVLVAILVYEQSRSTNFTAEARLSVSRLSGESTTEDYDFDDYYDLLASDFIVDDTVEVVRGNVFAAAVAERLRGQGVEVDERIVEGALDASREHRILTLTSTTNDHGVAVLIANMSATELQENFGAYLGVEGDPLPITIRPVEVAFNANPDDFRVRLVYLMALFVAGGLGLLLAIALEYFDQSLTLDSAPAATGLEVLGVVREG